MLAANLPSLRYLNLNGHGSITDEGVIAIAQQLTQLTGLELRVPERIVWDGELQEFAITDASIGRLGLLTQLQLLRLSECRVAEASCAAIGRLQCLQTLELSNCSTLTNTGVYSLGALTGLTDLNLSGCNAITDIGVATLARKLPLLRQLNLSAVHTHVTDVGIQTLQQLQQLQSLQLSSCYKLTDRAVSGLIAALPELKELSLRDCDNITDATVYCIARYLHSLTTLNLEHCSQVTDAGVLALKHLHNLQSLRVHGSGVSQYVLSNPSAAVVAQKQAWWMHSAPMQLA
jgi:hypothetical protein